MTNHVDARYDNDDRMFLPPLRTLGFNPKLTLNDSLLAQSYIEAYDISYPEAIHRIEDEVNELRQHLENNGSYELNDIGTLFLNDDGNMEFKPCEAGILTPSLYALSSFEIEKVVPTVEVRTAVAKDPKPAPLSQPSNDEALVEEPENAEAPLVQPVLDTDNGNTDDDHAEKARTVSISVSLLRNLAAAAIVLVAFLLYTSPLSEKAPSTAAIDSSMLLKVMPKNATTGSTAIAKTMRSTSATPSAASVVPVKQAAPATPASETSETVFKPYYTLVLASHVTKTNAAAYAEQLKKEGYEAQVITRSSTKVIYGQFATEGEAYNRLHQLNNQKPFAEAWVMKIEKP